MARAKRNIEWVECPGESILPGDYIRQVRPYPVALLHRVISIMGDLVHAEVVKKDGTRNRSWSSTGGGTFLLSQWVKVRAVLQES
jgi:hypothetical protein